jgi:hypothetical protein
VKKYHCVIGNCPEIIRIQDHIVSHVNVFNKKLSLSGGENNRPKGELLAQLEKIAWLRPAVAGEAF